MQVYLQETNKEGIERSGCCFEKALVDSSVERIWRSDRAVRDVFLWSCETEIEPCIISVQWQGRGKIDLMSKTRGSL